MTARKAIIVVVLVFACGAVGGVIWLSLHQSAGRPALTARRPGNAGQTTGRSLYQVADGKVMIPEFDDGRTSPTPRLRLLPTDFENAAKVYRGRVIVGTKPVATKAFTVPTEAKECVIRARAPQLLDVFPRIRVSLEAEDSQSTVVLCEALVNHVTLQDIRCPMPVEARKMFMGRIVIQPADTCFGSGWRSVFLAGVEFY